MDRPGPLLGPTPQIRPTPASRAASLGSCGRLVRPSVPTLPVPELAGAAVTNPIDRFVLATLAARGLARLRRPTGGTLLRRLSIDLTGLPPTPPGTGRLFGRYVGRPPTSGWSIGCWPARAMASAGPGTGSTWFILPRRTATTRIAPAQRLALSRLSDSRLQRGQALRPLYRRSRWPATCCFPTIRERSWRSAFWPPVPGTKARRCASSTTRSTSGIAQVLDRDDMIADLLSTVLSATVHCARCHNHKFDPIRQADYYACRPCLPASIGQNGPSIPIRPSARRGKAARQRTADRDPGQ